MSFSLRIISARGLRAADENGKSDPYVKIHEHPYDQWSKMPKKPKALGKTPVVKKNLNPSWDKEFQLTTSSNTLFLHVWDYDFLARNDDFLGEVELNLNLIVAGVPIELPVFYVEGDAERELSGWISLCITNRGHTAWPVFPGGYSEFLASSFRGTLRLDPQVFHPAKNINPLPSPLQAFMTINLPSSGALLGDLKWEVYVDHHTVGRPDYGAEITMKKIADENSRFSRMFLPFLGQKDRYVSEAVAWKDGYLKQHIISFNLNLLQTRLQGVVLTPLERTYLIITLDANPDASIEAKKDLMTLWYMFLFHGLPQLPKKTIDYPDTLIGLGPNNIWKFSTPPFFELIRSDDSTLSALTPWSDNENDLRFSVRLIDEKTAEADRPKPKQKTLSVEGIKCERLGRVVPMKSWSENISDSLTRHGWLLQVIEGNSESGIYFEITYKAKDGSVEHFLKMMPLIVSSIHTGDFAQENINWPW